MIGAWRTGQVVLILLMLYYGSLRLVGRVSSPRCPPRSSSARVYVLPDSAVHKRAAVAASARRNGCPFAASESSSVGERLEFYRESSTACRLIPQPAWERRFIAA